MRLVGLKRMKRIVSGLLIFVLAALTALQIGGLDEAFARRPKNGDVITGDTVVSAIMDKKTIDLTDSSVDIVITPEEKETLYKKAGKYALEYLTCVGLLRLEVYTEDFYFNDDEEQIKSAFTSVTGLPYYEGGVPYYSPKYWYHDIFDKITAKIDEKVESDATPESLRQHLKALQDISKMKDLDELLNTEDELIKEVTHKAIGYEDPFNEVGNDPSGSREIRGKREEIFNDLFSDELTAKISKELDASFKFDMVPLSDDGSEDERFGIGSTADLIVTEQDDVRVERGEFVPGTGSIRLSNFDFGVEGQFYDEVLRDDIRAVVAGNYSDSMEYDEWGRGTHVYRPYNYRDPADLEGRVIDNPDYKSKTAWDKGKEVVFGDDEKYYWPRDQKSIIDHVILIDAGYLKSSDDSQTAGGEFRGSAGWPGMHTLLDVSDPLGSYKWARFSLNTGLGYIDTFNLHLNPAVTYLATDIKEDLINDTVFDASGRLTSVSKPLLTSSDLETFTKKLDGRIKNTGTPGIYRFKLVESGGTKKLDNGDEFLPNEEEKIVDIIAKQNAPNNPVYYSVKIFEDAASAAKYYENYSKEDGRTYEGIGTEFTNKLKAEEPPEEEEPPKEEEPEEEEPEKVIPGGNKEKEEPSSTEKTRPDITKTIKGKGTFSITKIDDAITYKITTSVPQGAESFVVVDEMDKALKFFDEDKTSVTIGGKKLSEKELAEQVSQKNNTLKLEVTEEDLSDRAGEEITITFKAKINQDVDLEPYNGVIPNIAYYVMDGEESIKTGTAKVKVPKYHTDEPEDESTGGSDDEEEETTTTVTVKTGDENSLIPWAAAGIFGIIIMLVLIGKRHSSIK